MTESHPGVEDELERALRLGLATAAQLADRVAHARQDLARQAQYRDQQGARQLEARHRAEGASTTARLAVVDRPEWWDRATSEQIAGMVELAAQWQHDQPRAVAALETIARQVQDRYGIDLHAPDAEPAQLRAALTRTELERANHAPHGHSRASSTVTAVAAVLRADQRLAHLTAADEAPRGIGGIGEVPMEERADAHRLGDGTAAADAAPRRERTETSPYDSAERREQTALGLREAGVSAETIAVAMRADVAHARPAADAATATAHAGKPAWTRARGTSRSAQRTSRER